MATGLTPLAEVFREAAVAFEREGDPAAAALRWEKVVELEPGWTEGWCRLGDAEAAAGDAVAAHRAWRQGPFHPRCVESQGRAWLEEHPEWALQRFEALGPLVDQDPRTDLLVARALARLTPERGVEAVERYLVREGEPSEELLTATRELVAELEPDAALSLIRRVGDLDDQLADALADRRLALEVDVRADELMGAAPERLSLAQRAVLADARARLRDGQLDDARLRLERLADQVARSPEVWSTLADVREAQGDVAGAEVALQLARQLAPLNGALHARYADLLATAYGGRFDDEALASLERALDLGESVPLLERHVDLCVRTRRSGCALRSLERLASLGVDVEERLADLRRERPPPLVLPALPMPADVDPEAWRALHRSRVFEERARQPDGTWDPTLLASAVAEADRAVVGGTPEALNQRAHLHTLAGEVPAALELYERSLAQHADQVDVLGRIAELSVRQGTEDAALHLDAAAAAGDAWALVETADRQLAGWRWIGAWRTLERYFGLHASGPHHARARALRSRTRRTLIAGGLAGLALGFVLVGAPVAWLWRRRRGVDLQTFVDAHPRLAPEVVRVLSAIRHEVLKHNISALPVLAERLADGAEVSEAWLHTRLYGPTGALTRFLAYTRQLEDLARRAGTRLNLHHRDPLFAIALPAVRRLASTGPTPGLRSASTLAEAAEVLNHAVYDGLGTFIRDNGLLTLDASRIHAAWASVVAEHEDGRLALAFTVEGTFAGRLRIARADLHDILVNLLRNAVDASLEEGRTAIAVQLDAQEDFVTGLVRAEIRVCDQVERRLTTAMIRGRYIDRGLGLAVDLTSRSGGSIHVEAVPGFAKAVVVRLPAEET